MAKPPEKKPFKMGRVCVFSRLERQFATCFTRLPVYAPKLRLCLAGGLLTSVFAIE